MKYIMGIDQGGSKTHAIIVDETGKVLGLGRSYGACHSSTSIEYALQAVLEAADIALEESDIVRQDVHTIVAGMTGIDWNYEDELLKNAILQYFPKAQIQVENDCIIAMSAGTMQSNRGILCAGSGFNCAVQSGDKRFVYGFYIADEYQGGTCLGKKMLQAVFDSHMGMIKKTQLTNAVLEFFQSKTVDDLLYKQVKQEIKGKDYLKLPMLLENVALNGDKVAMDIWINYGKEMVKFLVARMKIMKMLDKEVNIVLSGSIFKCKIKEFQETVEEEILRSVPKANIIAAEYEPVVGAALMGLKKVTGQIQASYYVQLEKAAKQFPIKRM